MLSLLALLLPNCPATAANYQPRILKVGVVDHVIPAEQLSQAKTSLQQLVELIGRQVGMQAEVVIVKSGTQEKLKHTLRQLDAQELDLLALSGLEYAWARYTLGHSAEPIVVPHPGGMVTNDELLIARVDSKIDPKNLTNVNIQLYKGARPSMKVYLKQLRRRHGAQSLTPVGDQLVNATAALKAVGRRKAQTVIVDRYTHNRFARAFGPQARQLHPIENTRRVPLAAVIGNENQINSIREGLWADLRRELVRVNNNPNAAAFLEVWGVETFVPVPAGYEQSAKASAKSLPFNELPAR